MIAQLRHLRLVLPAAAVLALAGCGTRAASPASSTAVPTTSAATPPAIPTPAPFSTPVVTGGSVAAIVNGHAIPMSHFRLLLNLAARQSAGQPGVSVKQIASQTMNQLIVDELIREYAVAHGITVTNAELQAQKQKDIKALHGEKGFEQKIKELGLQPSDYETLELPSLLGQKVENQIAPPGKAAMVEQATVEHILIMTHPSGKPARTDAQAKALADKLFGEVKSGTNFAQLAKQYSDDPGSAAQGGLLNGCCRPGQTVPPFDKAVFSAPLHTPELVKSQYGYHIVVVLKRGKTAASSTDQQQAQRQKFIAWVNDQMKHAKIQRIAKVK